MASSVQNNRVASSGFCMCCRACNLWCWRAFKWLPVLLITSIVIWSYYAYVIELCLRTVESTVEKCVDLVLYHIFLFMFTWSYWRTIFAEIKPIPDKYKLPEVELEKLLSAESEDAQRTVLENFAKDLPIVTRLVSAVRYVMRYVGLQSETKKEILESFGNSIPVLTRTASGSVRYCNRCVLVKPDRAHHCSLCSRCVLKMDHHCPWVNNCVCYHNYKFFILFLGYALVYCLFITFTSMPYFIKFWKGDFGIGADAGRYHVLFAFFVSLMFAISLGSLFGYHIYLVINNRTTLDMIINYRRMGSPTRQIVSKMLRAMLTEAFRAPMFRGGADKNGFSIGAYHNYKEVFGNNPNLWLVPVFTSLGDGCEFPVRHEHRLQTFTTPQEAHGYESMGTTRSRSDPTDVNPSANAQHIP